MNITQFIADLTIDTSPEYDDQVNEFINMHNTSVASYLQSISNAGLVTLLIEKGIMTEEEYINAIERVVETSDQKEIIKSNRDALLQCIEMQNEFDVQLKAMHDEISNSENCESQPVDIPDVFKSDTPANDDN